MSGRGRWLTPASGYLNGYSHTLNPYVGCAFGCSYCYVRRMPVGLFRAEPWGSWVDRKQADPAGLAAEIAKAKRKGSVAIFFSSATDPYQPAEAKAGVTRSLLEAMTVEPPDFVLVQTRSPLVVRDAALLKQLGHNVRVSMTVETDREDVRKIVTPAAPPLAARMRAVMQLREAGIDTQIAVSPLLPSTGKFPAMLAQAASRVVVDDFFSGDGSGGRRSLQLGMRQLYERNGWTEWFDPSVLRAFVDRLRDLMPSSAIGVSAPGFLPPSAQEAMPVEPLAPPPAEPSDEDPSMLPGNSRFSNDPISASYLDET